jgi:hypothetical protein
MNREDIIRMAREAGFDQAGLASFEEFTARIERFAALVANEERQAVLDTTDALMGGERGRNNMFSEGYDYALGQIEEFVRARGEMK